MLGTAAVIFAEQTPQKSFLFAEPFASDKHF